ncbi:MAG: insulinase family protein [Alphaproteobacteria bacterium]|nr:insulinase family protein [Alphaproteobacteria bacterium]
MKKPVFLRNVCFYLTLFWVLSASYPAFSATHFTLKNGMDVYLEENHRAPAVTQMIFYKTGSWNEPAGKSGVAHLLEHMMFKGTKKFPSGRFSEEISRNGGEENAFTGKDMTAYHQTISKEHLPMIMEMEADRMQNLQFSAKEFAFEKQVVLEERLLRYENQPLSKLSEQMQLALFGNNPYGRPTIGLKEDIAALSEEDLQDFYQTYYRPENAFLVFSGDITKEELLPLAEKYYGVLRNPPQKPLPAKVSASKPQNFTQEITFRHPLVKQPIVMLSILNPDKDLILPAEVLAEIIGESSIGKLYLSLAMDKEIALSATAVFNRQKHLSGTFNISVIPNKISDIPEIKKELQQIKDIKISEKDINNAKERLISSLIYINDDILLQSSYLGNAIALGNSFSDYQSIAAKINAVTLTDVKKAQQVLFSDTSAKVFGILLPPDKSPE